MYHPFHPFPQFSSPDSCEKHHCLGTGRPCTLGAGAAAQYCPNIPTLNVPGGSAVAFFVPGNSSPNRGLLTPLFRSFPLLNIPTIQGSCPFNSVNERRDIPIGVTNPRIFTRACSH